MRFKKIAVALIMTSLLLGGCSSGSPAVSEQEVKLSATGAYTTMAENTSEQIFTSDDGVVIIKPTAKPEQERENKASSEFFDTAVSQERQAEKKFTIPNETKTSFNGSLGQLSIDKIGL